MVSGAMSFAVHLYDQVGGYLGNFYAAPAGTYQLPVQIVETKDGHVLVSESIFQGVTFERGILEYQSDGTRLARLAPPAVTGFFGLYELGNGNLLTTTQFGVRIEYKERGGPVVEMDRAGRIVETKLGFLSNPGLIKYAVQDTDGDGVADGLDGCPNDPTKTAPGACGCGVAETDTDGDGVADCVDNCPTQPNADQADSNHDGTGDACTLPPAASAGACGCSAGLPSAVPLTLAGMGWMRRKRLPPGDLR
jgi:hypothetical protein